jgi:hypothetical protein
MKSCVKSAGHGEQLSRTLAEKVIVLIIINEISASSTSFLGINYTPLYF